MVAVSTAELVQEISGTRRLHFLPPPIVSVLVTIQIIPRPVIVVNAIVLFTTYFQKAFYVAGVFSENLLILKSMQV